MNTHVKVVGWLWIVNGVVSFLVAISGLTIANLNIPNAQNSLLVTSGGLCLFLPGIIADFVAGYGLLKFHNWARILAIILAIFNLLFMCWLILPAALSIYTLIIMFNKETVALFKGEVTTAAMEKIS